MNKRINELIPDAIATIMTHMTDGNNLQIAKEYKGDISSLSAGIVRSGLLPTLSFFSQHPSSARDKEDTKSRRNQLMKAIKELFLKHSHFRDDLEPFEQDELLFLIMRLLNKRSDDALKNASRRFNFEMNEEREKIVKRELNEISVALKMAMRVFENPKSTEHAS